MTYAPFRLRLPLTVVFACATLLMGLLPPRPAVASAAATLNPTAGSPGEQVSVTGSGWTPKHRIQVQWDNAHQVLAATTVNDQGGFSVSFTVPQDAPLGGQAVYFVDAPPSGGKGLSRAVTFSVTQGSLPAPSPALSQAPSPVPTPSPPNAVSVPANRPRTDTGLDLTSGSSVGSTALPRRVTYVAGSTRKVSQLTGEIDRERQQPTANRTESRFGLVGTDLGASFEHLGRIYFLFGDTRSTTPPNNYRPPSGDSIAYTQSRNPESGVDLQFVTAPDGHYLSPHIPGISLGGWEVPTGGFSAHGRMYVFFTTDARPDPLTGAMMGRSILARSDDGGRSFHYLYDVSRERFINISPVVVNNREISGLPNPAGQGVLLWASGPYRRSNPYLAYLPLDAVEDRRALRYFAGSEAGSSRPVWSAEEAAATSLFSHPCIGELSVSWNRFLSKWLMLYNCDQPHGINFRVADTPWGPWSPGARLFDPWADGGYCHFIHVSWDDRNCDAVHDPGRERETGGPYGPYVISPYTTGDMTRTTIYYVMSTWNPYNIVLMRSTLELVPD